MNKRKTHTSTEVSQRYKKKVYSRYGLTLRKEEDAALIALIEKNKALGIHPTDTVRELFRQSMTEQ